MSQVVLDKVERFFEKYSSRTYKSGDTLIYANEEPEGIYFIVSGGVRQFAISPKGAEVAVNDFRKPAFFPMSWAINKTPNKYFFEAISTTRVKIAPCDEVVEFVRSNPDVSFDLLSRVFVGTDGLLNRMAQQLGGSVKNRMIIELVLLAKRFGETNTGGDTLIKINGSVLAGRVGVSRETISRTLKELKKAKLISVDRNKIVVHNMKQLSALVDDKN